MTDRVVTRRDLDTVLEDNQRLREENAVLERFVPLAPVLNDSDLNALEDIANKRGEVRLFSEDFIALNVQIKRCRAENDRLREEVAENEQWHVVANKLSRQMGRAHSKSQTIRAIASARLAHDVSTDEATVLWAIVNATEEQ